MWKIVLLAFPLLFLASGQETSIFCSYNFVNITEVQHYRCFLTLNNSLGFDNFTDIAGVHLQGMTNEDVTFVQRVAGYSTVAPRIICSQFPNLVRLDLSNLDIQAITTTSFGGCRHLDWLRLLSNGISSLSVDSFATNPNLTYLDLDRNLIPELHEDIFENLVNLDTLELRNNPFTVQFPGGLFRTLVNLRTLYIDNCRITEINTDWFLNKLNLEFLYIQTNQIRSVPGDAFTNIQSLVLLNLGSNLIADIHPDAFSPLINLQSLNLQFNWIEELHDGLFSQNNLVFLNLWGNGVKVLSRNVFGNLSNLVTLDCDDNVINSIEQSFIDDAVALNTFWFSNNFCASATLTNFVANRVVLLPRLQRCFSNFGYIVETSTDGNFDYQFFESREITPGIQFRVRANTDVHIAITAFNFTSSPMIEVFIGGWNNSRSAIRRNQATPDLVNIATPNILRNEQWTGFRITWANFFILVFREGEEFPLFGVMMPDWFPVRFYGIRSVGNEADWFITPV